MRDEEPFGSFTFDGFFPDRQKVVVELSDRSLKCMDCGGEFVFSTGEQVFYQEMQFKNEPKRCATCRAKHRRVARAHPETRTTCSTCGAETTVPFTPRQGRPVLCRPCFQTTESGRVGLPDCSRERASAR